MGDTAPSEASQVHQELLAQGERDKASWQRDLGGLLSEQDYRKTALRVADLEQLVADPQADPELRVAAALALPKDDDCRKRIRIAAAETADLDTQAALEAAMEDELAERQIRRARRRFDG